MKKITNLILEGGGVGAIAYAGFLKEGQQNGLIQLDNMQRVAGVSSGAIAATQIALQYSANEILESLARTDFKKFTQDPKVPDKLSVFTENGPYKLDFLYDYIGNLIKAKTGDENVTFADLHADPQFKDLYVVATKLFLLNSQPEAQEFIFSYEHTPGARVVDAVRASASLPFIFPPVRLLHEKNGSYVIHSQGDIYIDGGVLNAYPIRIFDQMRYLSEPTHSNGKQTAVYNHETLGLRLASHADLTYSQNTRVSEQPILNDFEYANTLFFIMKNGRQTTNFDHTYDQKRSIIIDTLGISSTQFDLTDQQKAALLHSGEQAAKQLAKIP
jgi:NTE family protein